MDRMARRAAILLAAALAVLAAAAQEPQEKVARVSVAEGEMSYQRGDDAGWNALGANTPLMTGDSLYAAQDGRAEVDLGEGVAVRLDNGTSLDLVNLTRDITQLGLTQGNADLSVRDLRADQTVEVDTPLAAATLSQPGVYRLGLDGDTARFGVVSGSLSVVLNGEQLDVQEGEVLELQGGNDPSYGYSRLPRGNDFDRWSEGRDSRRQRSASSRYVHNSVMGYDDLDDSGTWRQDRTYGNLWCPTHVSRDWAPYQTGRWVWQDPYGWTWVSYEPWGWAPYHYGRWVYVGNTWGWIPPPPMGYHGPRAVMNIRPLYSPCLVVFIGGSDWNLGVSLGGGGGFVGWVPLGPSDPYAYPWQSPIRVTNVVYQNIYINNSVTVVNYNNFYNGPVERVPVDRDAIRRAPVLGHDGAGLRPERGSLVPYPFVKLPPRAGSNQDRPLVARTAPPPRAVPFDRKLEEIQRTGRPVAHPVAADANAGRPFRPGMTPPEGVRAIPALGPANGPAPSRLKPRPGQEPRASKPVGQEAGRPAPVPQRPGTPEAKPLSGRPDQPERANPAQPRDPWQRESPKRELPPSARPDTRAPEPARRELPPTADPMYRQPETPKRELPPSARPDTRAPEPPRRELPPATDPGYRQHENPKREPPPSTRPDTRAPEPTKKELPPTAEPDRRGPEPSKKEDQAQPQPQVPPQAPVLTPEELKKAEEKRKAEEKKTEENKKAEERGR